jgi:outer membrane protein TolC
MLAAIGVGAAPPQAPTSRPPQATAPLPASVPPPESAVPLPPPLPDAAPPPPNTPRLTAEAIGTFLVPGQVLQPIDLASALRLGGARDLDIAIARQRICQAVADLQQARALWLPTLFLGPTWYRLDGKVQQIDGKVLTADRSALFIGGLAASPNSYPAAPPGSGYPPLTGLSAVLRISDAIYEPLAARRAVAANQATLQATINDALLSIAEAYFDLQLASGQLAIAREAADNAQLLSDITGTYARSGAGLEADHRRALAELNHQRKLIETGVGQLKIASANLIRLLVLNPQLVVAPVEPAEAIIHLVPDDAPLDDLIVQGLRRRPELAAAQELVQATLLRLKQARLRPLIPSLAFSYAGGGFGGGRNAFFGDFGTRGDATASLFWELQNLGFTDRAIAHRSAAQHQTAVLQLIQVENRVAAEVVAAFESRTAASRQIAVAGRTLTEAIQSLELNLANIRRGAGLPGATHPIEVLQPIQALAQARADYLDAVLAYNRAQFRLYRALGQPPLLATPSVPSPPAAGAILPVIPNGRSSKPLTRQDDPHRSV